MSESAAIATVSIENAAEQLQAKIRTAFVELIPPEQWAAMIKAELKRFTEPVPEVRRNSYVETPAKPSLFTELCREQFKAYIQEQVKAVLHSPEFSADVWRGDVSKVVKEWLTENAGQLIQSTILSLAGHAAQSLITMMPTQRVGMTTESQSGG